MKYNSKQTLANYRKRLKKKEEESKSLRILKKLFELNSKNIHRKNDNLIKLIASEDLLITAFDKISKNKGAATYGTISETPDETSMEKIRKIQDNLLKGKFIWSDVKRKYIPKRKKKELRPLGIPNFTDKLVQETIRIVLNAIYEPVFQFYEFNHGFRPKRSPETAIMKLQQESKEMTWALEGDIKGAFPSVNHNILLKVLKKKIIDKKFLKLIEEGLAHNIVFENTIEKNLTGTPQGGIASPILFNIYMHEFDVFVEDSVKELLKKNKQEGRASSGKYTRVYKRYSDRIDSAKKRLKKIAQKNEKFDKKEKLDYFKQLKKVRQNKKNILKLKISKKENSLLIRFAYVRFADDWILITNGSELLVKEIKEKFTNWLNVNLSLELDTEKTSITDIRKRKSRFLGFTIYKKKKRIIRKKTKNGKIYRQKSTVPLTIGIDHDKVKKRLVDFKVITEKNYPRSVPIFLQLKPYQIIEKFKQKLIGLFNYYYRAITYKSELGFYYYAYKFSCLKTIARRTKIRSRKLGYKYGYHLKITTEITEKTRQGTITKIITAEFPSYRTLMANSEMLASSKNIIMKKRIKNRRKEKEKHGLDPINCNDLVLYRSTINAPFSIQDIVVNLRTAFKLGTHCCICGNKPSQKNPIEIHHIKHVRKNKLSGFSEVMKNLNRKQIPTCRKCHQKIHRGEYDGFDLGSLFDQQITQV
jgi:group II intron reverse transcriptase/maturase